MGRTEQVNALQSYYTSKYSEILWVIVRIGGCILQQQLCRWLNNDQTDNNSNTLFVKKLQEAQLIKIKRIGSNSLICLTYPVFKYFNINRTVKINGSKIKRSAMIMEKYLKLEYYSKPPIELKKKLERTAALSYMVTGEPHLRLIQKYMPILESKGWNVDGLKHQEQILYKRFDYQTKFVLYENYPPLELDKEDNELDLYNLECQNSFITGIRFDKLTNGNEQLIVLANIYNIYEKDPLTIEKLILDTQRTIDAIFADYKNSNFSKVYITVYSHYAYSVDYEKKVYSSLCAEREYSGDEDLARSMVKLCFLNTKSKLFSNIDPSSIV